jgi:hypothetical protein
MNFEQAIEALTQGEKVKLPEWEGYWFKEENEIKVFTRKGEILESPYLNDYKNRTDWEITDGSRSFGGAITALKAGRKVARKGWNGKGMYLKMIESHPVNAHLYPGNVNSEVKGNIQGKAGQMLSHIVLKLSGDSSYWGEGYSDYVAWTASQTDILAEDWIVV